jgi:hypothetical protein
MNTRERVLQAFDTELAKARTENRKFPTAASIAKLAGISRSSIYKFHPGIVDRIRELQGDRYDNKLQQLRLKVTVLRDRLQREKDTVAALARACAEVAAERDEIRETLEDEKLGLRLQIEHLRRQLQGQRNVRTITKK